MMYVFGDRREVAPESARAVDAFARHTLRHLLLHAAEAHRHHHHYQQQEQQQQEQESDHSSPVVQPQSLELDDLVQALLLQKQQRQLHNSTTSISSRRRLLSRLANALEFKCLQDALLAPRAVPAPPPPPVSTTTTAAAAATATPMAMVMEDPLWEQLSKIPGSSSQGSSWRKRQRSPNLSPMSSSSSSSMTVALHHAADRVQCHPRRELLLDDPILSLALRPRITANRNGDRDQEKNGNEDADDASATAVSGTEGQALLMQQLLDSDKCLDSGSSMHKGEVVLLRGMLDSLITERTVDEQARAKVCRPPCVTCEQYI